MSSNNPAAGQAEYPTGAPLRDWIHVNWWPDLCESVDRNKPQRNPSQADMFNRESVLDFNRPVYGPIVKILEQGYIYICKKEGPDGPSRFQPIWHRSRTRGLIILFYSMHGQFRRFGIKIPVGGCFDGNPEFTHVKNMKGTPGSLKENGTDIAVSQEYGQELNRRHKGLHTKPNPPRGPPNQPAPPAVERSEDSLAVGRNSGVRAVAAARMDTARRNTEPNASRPSLKPEDEKSFPVEASASPQERTARLKQFMTGNPPKALTVEPLTVQIPFRPRKGPDSKGEDDAHIKPDEYGHRRMPAGFCGGYPFRDLQPNESKIRDKNAESATTRPWKGSVNVQKNLGRYACMYLTHNHPNFLASNPGSNHNSNVANDGSGNDNKHTEPAGEINAPEPQLPSNPPSPHVESAAASSPTLPPMRTQAIISESPDACLPPATQPAQQLSTSAVGAEWEVIHDDEIDFSDINSDDDDDQYYAEAKEHKEQGVQEPVKKKGWFW